MQNDINYGKALKLVQEGDILLFRIEGLVANIIQKAGEGKYSHVGVASWVNGNSILECVEFKQWVGGRSVSLLNYVDKLPGMIDVYRPVNYFSSYVFNSETEQPELVRVEFDPIEVTKTMRKMTGLPYGWRRIWWIAKHKLAIFKWFYDMDSLTDDSLQDIVYPVCGSAVAYAFSKHNYDLVKHRSDGYTEPSDIARSGRLSYLFTLVP